jgi:hypothetical protein
MTVIQTEHITDTDLGRSPCSDPLVACGVGVTLHDSGIRITKNTKANEREKQN